MIVLKYVPSSHRVMRFPKYCEYISVALEVVMRSPETFSLMRPSGNVRPFGGSLSMRECG
jgi:hypothetical protein